MDVKVKYIALCRNAAFKKAFENCQKKFMARYTRNYPTDQRAIDNVREFGYTQDPSGFCSSVVRSTPCPARPPTLTGYPYAAASVVLPADRTQYQINVLHWLKAHRQYRWLQALETFTYEKIQEVLVAEKQKDKGENKLYIITLPEFYFADINDDHKHTTVDYIENYSKPFYFDNVVNYFQLDPAAQTGGGGRLKALTREKNVIIIAGTIMWKQPNSANHMQETIYNTLPVFYEGECQLLWDKRYTSGIDGLGPFFPVPGPKTVKAPPEPDNRTKVRAVGSALSAFNPEAYGKPWIDFPFREGDKAVQTIRIGIDICLDYISGLQVMETLRKQKCWRKMPHFHVLVAGGMATASGNRYASKLFMRCEAGARGSQYGGETECARWDGTSWVAASRLQPKKHVSGYDFLEGYAAKVSFGRLD